MSASVSASQLAATTPSTRDRYVDLPRVASLGTVVLGHWLMAAVTTGGGDGGGGDGQVEVGNLLAVEPRLQILTWALQIMPVFFFVGGFSHALSYRSLSRKSTGEGTSSTRPSCAPASSGCCGPPWCS